jgi:hypothetical protein
VDRARHAAHEPTLAAALLVLAEHAGGRFYYDPTPANVDAALDATRKAAQLWPDGGTADALPSALVVAAILHAAVDSPPVARAVDADLRVHATPTLIHRMITGPDGEAALAALRRQPELAEAVRLRKAHPPRRQGLLDVALARVSGDAELEQAAAAAFKRADLGARLAIEATLFPGLPAEKAELELFQSGGR